MTNVESRPARLLVTMREAGQMLGVHERTVRNMIVARRLAVVRLGVTGRSVRIDVDDLRRLIEAQKEGGAK